MARSTWKGPFVDGYLLKKIQKAIDSGKKDVIKTWSRRSTILPLFVGFTFAENKNAEIDKLIADELASKGTVTNIVMDNNDWINADDI